jgi:hypothetical protein
MYSLKLFRVVYCILLANITIDFIAAQPSFV